MKSETGTNRELSIDAIEVNGRFRTYDVKKRDTVLESLKTNGGNLIHPVAVWKTDGHLKLVAGLHRLEACKELGWKDIPVRFVTSDDEDAVQLMELDENLASSPLTKLERGQHMKKRVELFLRLEGKKYGRDFATLADHQRYIAGCQNKTEAQAEPPTNFMQSTAKALNVSESSVKRDKKRGDIPNSEKLAGTAAENNGEVLDALGSLPKEEALEAVEEIAAVDQEVKAAEAKELEAKKAAKADKSKQPEAEQAAKVVKEKKAKGAAVVQAIKVKAETVKKKPLSAEQLDKKLEAAKGDWHKIEKLFPHFDGVEIPERLQRADVEAFLALAKMLDPSQANKLLDAKMGRVKRLCLSATDEERAVLVWLSGDRNVKRPAHWPVRTGDFKTQLTPDGHMDVEAARERAPGGIEISDETVEKCKQRYEEQEAFKLKAALSKLPEAVQAEALKGLTGEQLARLGKALADEEDAEDKLKAAAEGTTAEERAEALKDFSDEERALVEKVLADEKDAEDKLKAANYSEEAKLTFFQAKALTKEEEAKVKEVAKRNGWQRECNGLLRAIRTSLEVVKPENQIRARKLIEGMYQEILKLS